MRFRALSLGGLELRRFARAPLTRIALAALVLLPLLYAGLYLWSFWDPYAKTSRLPVALVVEDRPATVDGRTVDAGRRLAAELRRRQVFDWRPVDAATARAGVASGRFYLSLTIPAGFSASIASPGDPSRPPRAAALRVHLDDANGYVASALAEAAFKEIAAAAGTKAVGRYFANIFVSFDRLHGRLERAAQGAGDLAAGIDRARSGATRLREGIGAAKGGGDRLVAGLGTARTGADRLVAGLGRLDAGAARLESGGRQVAAGTRRLSTRFDQATGVLLPLLRDNPEDVRGAALAVARGADDVAGALDPLPGRSARAVREARQARRTICAVAADHPEGAPACRSARRVEATAEQLDDDVGEHREELRTVAGDARRLAAAARRIAAGAPGLAGRLEQARRDIHRLDAGAQRLATGLATLRRGIGGAYEGERRLGAGIGRLRAGAVELQSGLGRLHTGAQRLEAGLGQASDGAHRLASGLGEGARQVPGWDAGERDRRAGVMAQPVRLATTTSNKAPNYGTGFAPFFVPLALWVGAMFAYMVLRPLNPRALAAAAPAGRVTLAGWLPATLIGALQVLVLLGTLRYGLGLSARHWAGLVGFLLLASATFMAMMQFVAGRFGPAGRVIALVLLMLQLTSSAGTYPIQTSPAFFQALQPVLPMGPMVTALRHLIGGGPLTSVWHACAVLTGYLAASLALTMLTARRDRVWTMRRLHPVLKI